MSYQFSQPSIRWRWPGAETIFTSGEYENGYDIRGHTRLRSNRRFEMRGIQSQERRVKSGRLQFGDVFSRIIPHRKRLKKDQNRALLVPVVIRFHFGSPATFRSRASQHACACEPVLPTQGKHHRQGQRCDAPPAPPQTRRGEYCPDTSAPRPRMAK